MANGESLRGGLWKRLPDFDGLTIKQAARVLGVKERTLESYVRNECLVGEAEGNVFAVRNGVIQITDVQAWREIREVEQQIEDNVPQSENDKSTESGENWWLDRGTKHVGAQMNDKGGTWAPWLPTVVKFLGRLGQQDLQDMERRIDSGDVAGRGTRLG